MRGLRLDTCAWAYAPTYTHTQTHLKLVLALTLPSFAHSPMYVSVLGTVQVRVGSQAHSSLPGSPSQPVSVAPRPHAAAPQSPPSHGPYPPPPLCHPDRAAWTVPSPHGTARCTQTDAAYPTEIPPLLFVPLAYALAWPPLAAAWWFCRSCHEYDHHGHHHCHRHHQQSA